MADLAITAANVLADPKASIGSGAAGEAITAGQTLYLKAADSKLWKAVDTAVATAAAVGVALNNAAVGQPVFYIKGGALNPGADVVVGYAYGVTDNAGGIGLISERASGDYVTALGFATTTSNLQVEINATGVAIA